MSTIRFTSKEAFVAALEDRRPFWREYDRRQAREHKAAEKEWLQNSRAKLREALKMGYEDLKEFLSAYHNGSIVLGRPPECPVLMEHKVDGILDALEYTQARAFTVAPNTGPWQTAYQVLTWDPDAKKTVC